MRKPFGEFSENFLRYLYFLLHKSIQINLKIEKLDIKLLFLFAFLGVFNYSHRF